MKLSEYLKKHDISQEGFAKSLVPRVSQGLVWQWLNGETAITPERAKQIVAATKGEVTAHDLLPDIFPAGFEFPEKPKRKAA